MHDSRRSDHCRSSPQLESILVSPISDEPPSEGCFRRIPRLDRRLHRSKQRLLSHQLQPSEVVMDSSQRVWLFSAVLMAFCCLANAVSVSHDGRALIIDGQRRIIISGSIHYPRSTPEMWPDLIQKAKEGGLDAIETLLDSSRRFRMQNCILFSELALMFAQSGITVDFLLGCGKLKGWHSVVCEHGRISWYRRAMDYVPTTQCTSTNDQHSQWILLR